MSDSLFSNAGWFFFVAWSLIVAAVSVDAFIRDLLPSKLRFDQAQKPPSMRNRTR
mgnify:CR=1 FL=1